MQYHHKTFAHIEKWLHNSLKKFTEVSRALKGTWEETVFPYERGKIAEAEPSYDSKPVKTFTLAKPHSRKSYEQRMREANEEIASKKFWTIGLYEGVVAAQMLTKSPLRERNRIALIVLDSTLEIAFKDYLANETNNGISDKNLFEIALNRVLLVDRVTKESGNLIDVTTRQQLDYFYRLRCELVHKRADTGITPEHIESYRHLVQTLLNKMFGIHFVDSGLKG